MNKVSFFEKVFDKVPKKEMDFDEYLSGVKMGFWQDKVLDYKNGKIEKRFLPAITTAGIFKERNSKSIIEHSGIINIDIDAKDNPELNLLEMRDEIAADGYIYAMHISVSGKGLSCYIKINPAKHYDSFIAIEKYFSNEYKIIIDKSGKDVPRLRFVSFDPELYLNKKAKKWNKFIEKAKQPPKNYSTYIASKSDFDMVMEQIVAQRINIAEDYHDWIKVGFAIASEFGQGGMSYFHDVSKMSVKYNDKATSKKYNSLLKSRSNGVTIKTFFWMAERGGCQIKSIRTRKIEQVARIRMKQVGQNGGMKDKSTAEISTKKYLKDVEGIEGADVDEIISQVKDLTEKDLNSKSDIQMKVETIVQVINQEEIVYNKITGKLEKGGDEISDIDINSLFVNIIMVDKSITRALFDAVLFSDRVKNIDPFQEFFKRHKHLKPTGNFELLIDCIDDESLFDGEYVREFKQRYLKKWMLSIIASMHGTYSLIILVFTGKQGTGKTNFFRWLLPKELKNYYAESKLDAGKDDEILMTQKLLIIDDEFGGKSKREAKKLKDLSSKQHFSIRRPYGRTSEDMLRIAVLGGTSNDNEVIDDPTGNRRIVPIKINSIDFEKYKEIDKTELFIELYHEWIKTGDKWMMDKEDIEILNRATGEHEIESTEESLLIRFMVLDINYSEKVSSADIKIKIEQETQQKLSLYKISANMKKLGYVQKIISVKNENDTGWITKRFWNARFA